MTYNPDTTTEDLLKTWVATEIAHLAGTLSAPTAGLLLLDAQITDLEIRCAAARQYDNGHKLTGRESKLRIESSQPN